MANKVKEGEKMENNFIVGKTYTAKSACDQDCIFSATVINKTAKTVIIKTRTEGAKRCKVHTSIFGGQYFYPFGRYSMAPIMRSR